MRQEKLQQIIEMLSIMQNMIDDDLAIAVWDREGTVLYFQKSNTFSLTLDVGYKHNDRSDKIFHVMSTGKVVHNILPKEAFGVSVEGNIVPIFDNGEIVGCITCVYSVEKLEEANRVKQILEESKDSICNILNDAVDINKDLEEVNKYMNNLEKSIEAVYAVVDSIKSNTSKTKMLSLNAAIEAARAGEYGKGFTIVANEMGKLAQMSTESVEGINNTLSEMITSINDVTKSINKVNEASFKNSETVDKMLSTFNETIK